MTIERRLVIGLEDIKAIVYECVTCEARLSVSPDKEMPHVCQCGQAWITPGTTRGADTEPVSRFLQLTKALRGIRETEKVTTLPVRIFFEIEEPKPL